MRNGILTGIALVAIMLGVGAIVTASYGLPDSAHDIHSLTDGRASSDIQPH